MFGGEGDDEYPFSGMMWADNYSIYSDDRKMWKYIVNDIIEELMILDMEPKRESLWWTCTYKAEDRFTLVVGGGGECWEMPFVERFDSLEYRFRNNGKGVQVIESTLKKGMEASWWRDACVCRAKSVS